MTKREFKRAYSFVRGYRMNTTQERTQATHQAVGIANRSLTVRLRAEEITYSYAELRAAFAYKPEEFNHAIHSWLTELKEDIANGRQMPQLPLP